jgi:hypothetical protein
MRHLDKAGPNLVRPRAELPLVGHVAFDNSTWSSLGSFCRKWQWKKTEFFSPLGRMQSSPPAALKASAFLMEGGQGASLPHGCPSAGGL